MERWEFLFSMQYVRREVEVAMTEEIIYVPAGFYSEELAQILNAGSTFDGYDVYGEDLGQLANEVMRQWRTTTSLPDDLTLIKACLFFEGRRGRFVGGYPAESDMPYLRALMAEIQKSQK
jgi:hypothetical protein